MKYLSMKILVALGLISTTSFQGVYAVASKLSETNLDKIAFSISSSEDLSDDEKIKLTTRIEIFDDLEVDEQEELIEELEENDIEVPQLKASQPTFISNKKK